MKTWAIETEMSETVRAALIRAVAAHLGKEVQAVVTDCGRTAERDGKSFDEAVKYFSLNYLDAEPSHWAVAPAVVHRACLQEGCGRLISADDRVLYFPRRARAMCPPCGEASQGFVAGAKSKGPGRESR